MRTTTLVLEGIAGAIVSLRNRVRAAQQLAFWKNNHGQDLIEYALLAGFITVLIGAILPSQLIPPLRQLWILIGAPLSWAAGGGS